MAETQPNDKKKTAALHAELGMPSPSPSKIASLLKAGADPDAPNKHGETPLVEAARSPKATVVLLAAGANPNTATADGWTPLHEAVPHGPESAGPLLEAGANPNATNHRGETPLHIAAASRSAAVDLLLEAGADPTIRDGQGRLPEDRAEDDDGRAILAAARETLELGVEARRPRERPIDGRYRKI
jgi:ankyrin repeat protein